MPAHGPAEAADSRLAATWFDGRSGRARAVQLQLTDEELQVQPDDGPLVRYPRRQVGWPELARHGHRVAVLPDGGTVQVDDGAAWDRWVHDRGHRAPWAARLASSWRHAMLALVLVVAVGLAGWRWGIPLAAQTVAAWIPQAALRSLDDTLVKELSGRGWLAASELPLQTRQDLERAVAGMVAAAYPRGEAPAYRLSFHKLPKWMGPNAFALPGGRIVVADALVRLLSDPASPGPAPAVLGVVAHELGHVRERHGLRLLVEAGATGVLLGWWIGDYSAVLAGAPAAMLQAGYARGHERAADIEALRIMQAAGIDPRAMASFFRMLQKRLPERDGDSPAFGLSTHPADSERIEFFESAARAARR